MRLLEQWKSRLESLWQVLTADHWLEERPHPALSDHLMYLCLNQLPTDFLVPIPAELQGKQKPKGIRSAQQ